MLTAIGLYTVYFTLLYLQTPVKNRTPAAAVGVGNCVLDARTLIPKLVIYHRPQYLSERFAALLYI